MPTRIIVLFTLLGLLCLQGNANSQEFPEQKIGNSERSIVGFQTPEQSLKSLDLPPEFSATLFAAEPSVRQPIAATTDPRGRLWVCENYTYSESKVNFDLTLRDRILILEDSNGDGKFDSRKVFWDQGQRLTSVEIGFGGVYVLCAPTLLFIPDRDHDDVPDGPPEVLLDGWNDSVVRHNIVNGLMWGPDGWLYGRHGILGTSWVGRPGSTPSQRTAINCGIWRYHPLQKKFEVVAHGTTNPWGMDYDRHGELFMINTVIGHLWHVMPGARYDRMYGSHFNPYTYRTIEQTADHYHWNKTGGEAWHDTKKIGVTSETDKFGGGHAHCGMLIYDSGQWPQKYHQGVFTCNLLGHRINHDRLEPQHAGFVGKHQPDFARTTDSWFRGIELVRSHNEGFYVLDWQDTGECHENDGVHRTSGRIFQVHFDGAEKVAATNLYKLSDRQLLKLMKKSRWHFEKATIVLRERLHQQIKNGESVSLEQWLIELDLKHRHHRWFREILAGDYGIDKVLASNRKLNQLFSEAISDPESTADDLISLIHIVCNDPNPEIRKTQDRFFAELAKSKHDRVRLHVAAALPKLTPQRRKQTVDVLLGNHEDAHDRQLPLLIWYAIEDDISRQLRAAGNLDSVFNWINHSQIPLVTQFCTRRLAEHWDRIDVANRLTAFLAKCPPNRLRPVLLGMADAVEGRSRIAKPENWDQTVQSLNLDSVPGDVDPLRKAIENLNLVFGVGRSLDRIVSVAKDSGADNQKRGQAILTVAKNGMADLAPFLHQLINDKAVQRYVIQAYAYCDEPEIANRLIRMFGKLKPDLKPMVIDTLVGRAAWANQLLQAVEKNKIDKSFLTALHARKINDHQDAKLSERLAAVWGTVRTTPAALREEIEKLQQELSIPTKHDADLSSGRKLFEKHCGNCHVMLGTGGKIGPDLTGSNRQNLYYLLENIVDPNASVADSFQTSLIQLSDGRSITGVVLRETPQLVVVQTDKGETRIDREEIEAIKVTKKSLMPEGLLQPLNQQQRHDLFRYLQTAGPQNRGE